MRGRSESLARQFDRVLRVLEAWGYVDGWSLTDAGERLARLYTETDLLLAEALREGLLDGLSAPELAAVVSCFTYERRGPDGQHPMPPARWPTKAVAKRPGPSSASATTSAPTRTTPGSPRPARPIPASRPTPTTGRRGDSLADVLDDDEMTGGDFVRHVKQCIDLLRQVGDVAPNEDTLAKARVPRPTRATAASWRRRASPPRGPDGRLMAGADGRKGVAVGAAGDRSADWHVDGDDATLAAAVQSTSHGARRVEFRPDADVRSGPGARAATGPGGRGTLEDSWRVDALRITADGRELFGVNMLVVGVAARPRHLVRPGTRAVTVTVDRRSIHDGPATAVVVASGQYLRGADLVPRGHPGDGRAEIQVYAAPGRRRARRPVPGPPRATHLPHPGHHPELRQPGRDPGRPGQPAARARRRERATGSAGRRRGRARGLRPGGLSERSGARRAIPVGGPRRADTIATSPGGPGTEARTWGVYPAENFTDDEAAILRPYFTNLDRPVFALVNLPEVVKGALFARYSRTHKSLRRLFLDEFVADLDLTGDLTVDATIGLKRAEELYDRVFLEYGDDSVAQLGGVHLACEQSSNLLTKILEWGRLMAYLEQSTRYIPYDAKLDGRYRYYRDTAVLASRDLAWRYIADMDAQFDAYAELLPQLTDWARERYPKEPGDSDFVYKQTIKAKACDAVRGILPAATLSNVGIYGTGQGFEALLLRMRRTRSPRPAATRR